MNYEPTQAIGIDELERLMVAGMPPLQEASVGDWLVRSANGFTGRANSALVIGSPGIPVPAALDRVCSLYAELRQPALFHLPGPVGFDPSATPVGSQITARGGRIFQHTLVLTAPVKTVVATPSAPSSSVVVASRMDEQWWASASARSREHRHTVEQIAAGVGHAHYLNLRKADPADPTGVPVGSARLAVHQMWAGIFDLHVVPEQRGHGYGAALMGGLARATQEHHVPMLYLQVSADNTVAVDLYQRLGFTVHHDYWYARLDSA